MAQTKPDSSQVIYKPVGTGAVATTVHKKLRERVSVADFGAVCDGVNDDTAAIQAAVTASRYVLIPGVCKITASIVVIGGTTIVGYGRGSGIIAYGCDAFTINGGTGDGVTIQGLALSSYTAGGVADPRLYRAIACNGTSGNAVNNFTGRDLYLQGWQQCIYWAYTWSSLIDNVSTVNCEYSLKIFGQSVNNSVVNCRLLANGGQASIVTRMDGVIQGEGLMVTNCLLSAGAYAWDSDGWLSVGFHNCVVDLISNIAFNNSGYVIGFTVDCPWVYSANRCFAFANLGAPNMTDAAIRVGLATTTSVDSLLVFGTNNQGLTVTGGTFSKLAAGGYTMFIGGPRASISGVTFRNNSGNPAIYVNSTDVHINGLAGDTYVQWGVSPVKSIVSAATLSLPVPNQDGQTQGVIVTGNTTVAAGMNDAGQWAGKTVLLQFTGTPIITDGGNLKLNGNFVATPDDTLTLWSDGTNWFEMARSAN